MQKKSDAPMTHPADPSRSTRSGTDPPNGAGDRNHRFVCWHRPQGSRPLRHPQMPPTKAHQLAAAFGIQSKQTTAACPPGHRPLSCRVAPHCPMQIRAARAHQEKCGHSHVLPSPVQAESRCPRRSDPKRLAPRHRGYCRRSDARATSCASDRPKSSARRSRLSGCRA